MDPQICIVRCVVIPTTLDASPHLSVYARTSAIVIVIGFPLCFVLVPHLPSMALAFFIRRGLQQPFPLLDMV